jgi:hypothetical protein
LTIVDYNSAIAIWECVKTNEGDLKRELLLGAVRYARLRADWHLATSGDRREMEASRTTAHNALIDAANILARAMVKRGEDANWRRYLGDDRKIIGDWACFIHAYAGIQAR